jgi:hypothetical protein
VSVKWYKHFIDASGSVLDIPFCHRPRWDRL